MGYSFYEVYITAQRAFRGMGFPFGADEDAGFIIAWLELNKFNGIEMLYNSINQIDQKYNGIINIQNINKIIDFENQSILMKGPSLIDYMQSLLNNSEKVSITITNCLNGIFFLPLLYKTLSYIKYSELIFFKSNKINYYQLTKNKITFKILKEEENILPNQIKINMINNKLNKSFNVDEQIITEKIIQENLSKSLTPQDNHWEKILKIANRTFVPESKESRIRGAGGGDDND